MQLPDGLSLVATICNTVPNAVPYTLWFARGEEQFLIDMSRVLNRPGDTGLTGMVWHNERLYLAVQSSATPRVLILDRQLVPLREITCPEFADLHSLHVFDDTLLVISTGNRSVLQFDLARGTAKRLCQLGEGTHVNSAWFDGKDLLVCCHLPPSVEGHGILNLNTGRLVLTGLSHPHSLIRSGDAFLALDSAGSRLIRFDDDGIRQDVSLPGFLRGCAAARGTLFVGSSTRRVVSRKNPTMSPIRELWEVLSERVLIHELDESTLEPRAEHAPAMAGYEIYELLALDGRDTIEPPADRLVAADQNAISKLFYYNAKTAVAQLQLRTATQPG